MSVSFPSPFLTITPAARGRIAPSGPGISLGGFRLPTDPLFYASLTLRNAVVGSRYRITRLDNGDELATGVVVSDTEVIANVPCFTNPMLLDVVIRKGTSGAKYLPYQTQAEIQRAGSAAFIAQVPDTIA